MTWYDDGGNKPPHEPPPHTLVPLERCPTPHPVLRVQCERWAGHDGAHRFEVRWLEEAS